jgi:glycosyltransferase involved in cell wall biosynthesis
MRDLIEGGRCGWLCPPGRPDLLAQEMLAAANTPAEVRAQMGKLGREHAVAHYSLTQMTDGYESLFASHIGRRSSP